MDAALTCLDALKNVHKALFVKVAKSRMQVSAACIMTRAGSRSCSNFVGPCMYTKQDGNSGRSTGVQSAAATRKIIHIVSIALVDPDYQLLACYCPVWP